MFLFSKHPLLEGEFNMLKYTIRGENIEVTPAIRDYVEKKVGKVERYFDQEINATAHVNLRTYSDNTAVVEVTIPLKNLTVRAEEDSQDLYGSIDLVVDKLERQIRKHKTKLNRRSRETGLLPDSVFDESPAEDDDEGKITIARSKRLSLKPMNDEEAVLQMEMLGHDFFIFEDAETDATSIVYRRKDGDYGLIETDIQ